MKFLRIATVAGLLLASAIASAAPGGGITGTKHDWGGAPVVTAADGSKTGGTSVWYYFSANPLEDNGAVKATLPAISTNYTLFPVYGVLATQNATTLAWTYAGDPAKVIPAQDPTTSAWSYSGGTNAKQATDNIQIGQCTRCHTPHRAKSTLLLWNHTLSTSQFAWDQATTTAGTKFATFKGDSYKGPTTKCLSCHDGTLSSTDGMWFGRTFNKAAKYAGGSGDLLLGKNVTQNGIAGGNLSGMHPVAMPYPYGGAGSTYNGVTSRLTGADGDGLTIGEWQDNPATKGIRLFKDDGSGNITAGAKAGSAGMECSSCHDVHNGARTKDAFLVTGKLGGTAADGYICQSCHKK